MLGVFLQKRGDFEHLSSNGNSYWDCYSEMHSPTHTLCSLQLDVPGELPPPANLFCACIHAGCEKHRSQPLAGGGGDWLYADCMFFQGRGSEGTITDVCNFHPCGGMILFLLNWFGSVYSLSSAAGGVELLMSLYESACLHGQAQEGRGSTWRVLFPLPMTCIGLFPPTAPMHQV